MNILIVASWYPYPEEPYKGSFFREQAVALSKAGHNVTVVTVRQLPTNLSGLKKHGTIDDYDDNGVRTLRFWQLSMGCFSQSIGIGKLRIPRDKFFSHNEKAYRRLYRKLQKEGASFDIVHAHAFSPGGYCACRLKKIFGAPVVVTEHCSFISAGKFTPRGRQALRYTITASDSFNCVSGHLAARIREQLALPESRSLGVLPNILSPYFHINADADKHKEFTFVSVGGLIPRKGFDITIKAFAQAFPDESGVRLEIIGRESEIVGYGQQLSELAKQCGVSDRVEIKEPLDRSELADELRRCHCFVLASRLETFGVVYIEAMACGLPTIGTLNGGSDDVLTQNGALSVPIDDAEALSAAMLRVYHGQYPSDTNAVSEKIISTYGEESICRQLEQVYRLAIEGK